ncbi:MAG: cardiolipin synthase B [Burkholderiales bacterium]|nr:cardiolipin synthase B [Burkholderiales bacterium]
MQANSAAAYADQAFLRAAGAPLVEGNSIRILRDAAENFPAWLAAIRAAQRSVFFECYIIDDDPVGREFIAALAERARSGVRVRLIYDWFGTPRGGWIRSSLEAAGATVRCFNPPSFASPFGWISRDHRKMIAVDGQVGFVSGLCVSAKWLGDAARGLEPWRDTGVEIRGPAVADLEDAFAQVWDATGADLLDEECTPLESIARAGDVALRVIAGRPESTGVFRLDQFIAAVANERLWLTDAYFVGTAPYVQALRSAARDGVDVRLLVPGSSDVPIVGALSRAGYRSLLEGGVRVFEWNGRMLHAKTAVADGRWARIGSTNLNVASWLHNYELDVAVEDEAVAKAVADMYEQDLAQSTEIVLRRRHWVRPRLAERRKRRRRAASGSAGRAAAGALSIGSVVGAALTNRRSLDATEANLLMYGSAILFAVAVVAFLWPKILAIPFAVIAAWIAGAMLLRAARLRRAPEPGPRKSDPDPDDTD